MLIRDLQMSVRQAQILACLCVGQADKQIADCIGISLPTLRTHMARLFDKYKVSGRVELVLHIVRRCKVTYQSQEG